MPQHAKRLKIRRKDLRKPDEFETLTGQAVDWAQANRSIAIGVAVGVAVIALAVLGIGRWRAGRNETAATAFHAAQAALESGKDADAAQAFAEVANDYPSTPFGRLAKLYRAHALARQGDQGAAATAYGEYLATAPEAEYLRQEALLGLARAKEASGDAAGALDSYTQAGALGGPYRNDALLGAARIYAAAGRTADARKIYETIIKEAPDPETKELIGAKLATVDAAQAKQQQPQP